MILVWVGVMSPKTSYFNKLMYLSIWSEDMRSVFIAFVTTMFLALTTQAYGQQKCTPQTIGKSFGCSYYGKPGTKVCLEPGTFSPCKPTPNPPAPVKGSVFGKYIILTVIYAPPGTNGGRSTSQVTYESDSSTGKTTTNSSSFKQDYSVSASVECTDCDFGVLSGGASFEYTNNHTQSDALDVKKTTSSIIQDTGPAMDGVDHNHDQIWVFLHPKFDVTIWGNDVIDWSFDPDQSAGLMQYLYVEYLKDPSKIPAGLLHDLQVAGITTTDYPEMLKADPLAQCLPPEVLASRVPRSPLPTPLCRTPIPGTPRYVPANINLPYNPPLDPNDAVPLQTQTIDNASISTHTDSYEDDYKVGITASGGFNFLDVYKATVKTDDSWTWTDINTTAASTGSEQKMSLALGGPAYGYNGDANIDVYFDTLYQTFAFVPTELSADVLHGVVLNGLGKPVVGKLVAATAGGIKYRTYTNAKGEYRFSKKLTGPILVQAGPTALRLPRMNAAKSVDFHLR